MQCVFAYTRSQTSSYNREAVCPTNPWTQIDLFVRQSTQRRNELNQRLQQNSIKSIKELLNKIRAKNSLDDKFFAPVIAGNRLDLSPTPSLSLDKRHSNTAHNIRREVHSESTDSPLRSSPFRPLDSLSSSTPFHCLSSGFGSSFAPNEQNCINRE